MSDSKIMHHANCDYATAGSYIHAGHRPFFFCVSCSFSGITSHTSPEYGTAGSYITSPEIGHRSLETTMGYLHAESLSVRSPLETLPLAAVAPSTGAGNSLPRHF
jgi:hypothetical protein